LPKEDKEAKVVEPKVEAKPKPVDLRPEFNFSLPDGRSIKMGKPPIPTVILLPAILGALKSNNQTEALYNEAMIRAAIYIREIDGRVISPPDDFAKVSRLMMDLGDDGSDLVMDASASKFTPPSLEQLENLKKQ
jgi:hypothetical protein